MVENNCWVVSDLIVFGFIQGKAFVDSESLLIVVLADAFG